MHRAVRRRLHVYQLSRLVHASPAQWERLLTSMEEDKERAYNYYQPMRQAAAQLCSLGLAKRDLIVGKLISDAARIRAGKGQNPVRDNVRAFEAFELNFYPKVRTMIRSLLREDQQGGVTFEGLKITGLPHLEVEDRKGNVRYVFLYPSIWNRDDLKAYLELLYEIVRVRFRADPKSIWCMGLREGKTIRFKPSRSIRRKCQEAAQHFCRFATAQEESEQ